MNMSRLVLLNERFGIDDQVVFSEGPGGLTVVQIANSQAVATVALQGAQLLDWTPRGGHPVIWLSRDARFEAGQPIRGGVPVCWPWFGPHATRAAYPAHGFVRTIPWQVSDTGILDDGGVYIAFLVEWTDATDAIWPHLSELELGIRVGTRLELHLVTRNTGTESMIIGDALHAYFAVSDVRHITVDGLDGCLYIDKLDGNNRKRQSGAVTFNAETDRIYVDSTADCVISDPGMQRRIRITKRGSRSTVVWNPWIEKAERMADMGENGYLDMVCVESTNAADDLVTIAPGGEHRLGVSYQVEPL